MQISAWVIASLPSQFFTSERLEVRSLAPTLHFRAAPAVATEQSFTSEPAELTDTDLGNPEVQLVARPSAANRLHPYKVELCTTQHFVPE